MTTESSNGLVLRDGEGNYYRISREVLEAHRVSEEERPGLEAALGGDTGGFLIPASFVIGLAPVSTPPSGQPAPKVAVHDFSFTH